ncbi:hypothetical protein BsIDN1_55450 [Bacillus safensis]|uniref:Alcohol dehydrogenase iron-type/glycerol dehydrogenase GldA domain-containing protein n=1 Tax=Bacillus safensis TaxID=561879 RepID=A0A5S9MEL3_BACIA|nr:hypothetical protein BsIDN1_55450 [Bacillus safensis]
MENFIYYNPTKLMFGKGQLEGLKSELARYGKRVLLVYGGGSIKKNGLYDNVISALNEADAEVFELSGVEPNPRLTTVKKRESISAKRRTLISISRWRRKCDRLYKKQLQPEQSMTVMCGILFQRKQPLKKHCRLAQC